MATILRGKRKGEEVRLIQWANDWVMVEPCETFNPTSVKLTTEEVARVRNDKHKGMMDRWYTLSDDGIFKKVNR